MTYNKSIAAINFKEPVAYNQAKDTFEQLSWTGRFMRYIPFYGTAQDQKVMQAILGRLKNENLSIAERVQWAQNAKLFAKNILDNYKVRIKDERKKFSDVVYLASLGSLGLTLASGNQYKDFVKFIRINHFEKMIANHGHEIKMCKITNEPMILLEGRYTPWSAIKKELSLSDKKLSLKGKGWSYLGESDFGKAGLVRYDAEKWEVRKGEKEAKPRPYCQLTPEQMANLKDAKGQPVTLPLIENYVDCRAPELPSKALENNDHCFKKMIDKRGNVYWFGFSPKEEKSLLSEISNALASNQAVIESPDHYVDVPAAIRMSQMKRCTQAQFDEEFAYIVKMHHLGTTYNVFNNNCQELVIGADEHAHLPIPPADELRTEFYKVFPIPLQVLYNWFPLPRFCKRWIIRSLMNIAGFNKGITVGGVQLAAKQEFSIWEDLKVPHPRLYLQYLKKLKAAGDPDVLEH